MKLSGVYLFLCRLRAVSLFLHEIVRGVHARASVERRSRETRCLSRLAPSVTRVVIWVSRAFCSTDQEKRETARSLLFVRIRGKKKDKKRKSNLVLVVVLLLESKGFYTLTNKLPFHNFTEKKERAKHLFHPTSRGFSLAGLLAFTKSFAWLDISSKVFPWLQSRFGQKREPMKKFWSE